MKLTNLLFLVLIVALSCFPLAAKRAPRSAPLSLQTAPAQHKVTLSWAPSADAGGANPVTYDVYRAPGACSSSSAFASIATGIATANFADTSVAEGSSYCYVATAVAGGLESARSNEVTASVAPFPPTALTATAD